MKTLESLKADILQGKLEKLYIFYGEDYGIRKHYINKICESFKKVTILESYKYLQDKIISKSLFKTSEIFIIYGDEKFLKEKPSVFSTILKRLTEYTVIFVYENEDKITETPLFKYYSNYVTYFPTVQDNIAMEFVTDELSITEQDKEDMIYNCSNNYNNILLEANKIKNYAENKNMSEQTAYNSLSLSNQLLVRDEVYNSDYLMNDILMGNNSNISYWYKIVKNSYIDEFVYSLYSIFQDYLIALLLKKYGWKDGGERCYKYRLNWGRTKVIRELKIPYDYKYLGECAYRISLMDKLIKTGKILKENAFDYFINNVV